jgi:hypothetical protein
MTRPQIPGIGLAPWLLSAAAVVIASSVATASPDRTPTPVPRLSGGFGRPRATPVPAAGDGGQSLTDVVHAAQQAREQSQSPLREKSGLTINNRTLVKNPDKGRITTGKPAPTKESLPRAAAGTATAATSQPPSSATPEAAPPQGTEAQWRETARQAGKRVEDAKARVAELTAAAKKLENDFYAWDDGQYRDRVIKPSWDKTREQLEDAKRELAEAEKELADLPEKARKAGAMPGWIRE